MNIIQKCQDALNRLEANFLTPVVPGELIGWIDAIADSADLVGALFWRETETIHQADYSQIVQQDPELCARVERLRKGDRECLERLEALLDQITKLKKSARQSEPDEGALKTSVEALIQNGLAWLLDAKRQEKACETWLMEAVYRDRGIGD